MGFSNFFQNNYTIRRRLFAIFAIIILGTFFAKTIPGLYKKSMFLLAERKRQEEKLQHLVVERKRLEDEITFLRHKSSIEREAKARLNYKKTGEKVVVVVPEERSSAAVLQSLPRAYSWRERIARFFTRLLGLTMN